MVAIESRWRYETCMWHFLIETASRFVQSAPAKLWFGAFAVGCAIEFLTLKAERDQSWRGYARNIGHSLVYLMAIFLLAPSVYAMTSAIARLLGVSGLINVSFVDNTTRANAFVGFIIYFLIIDFFQYWWHRLQHRVPFLWDQHVVHHSEESMNVTTATRHHWSEFVFQAFVIALPVGVLFKITPATASFVALPFSFWQFFVHLNVRLPLGRLAWLAAGPQLHRIHHSRLPEHRDRNFAAFFPIWDVLFGTYYHPSRGEYPPTGVTGTRIDSIIGLSTHPFQRWGSRLLAARSLATNFPRPAAAVRQSDRGGSEPR